MKFEEVKSTLLVTKNMETGKPQVQLPITSGDNVYLDNKGTVVNDVLNDTPVIDGSSADEFLIFHFATAEEKLHFFKFMSVLTDPSEIYLANFIIKSEAGAMNSKLNEFTESSGRPVVKIWRTNTLIMDLKNVEKFSLYSDFYGTLYNQYKEAPSCIVAKYRDFIVKYPNILPEHTSAENLRTQLDSMNGLFSSIGGRLTFITNEEIDAVFEEVFGQK